MHRQKQEGPVYLPFWNRAAGGRDFLARGWRKMLRCRTCWIQHLSNSRVIFLNSSQPDFSGCLQIRGVNRVQFLGSFLLYDVRKEKVKTSLLWVKLIPPWKTKITCESCSQKDVRGGLAICWGSYCLLLCTEYQQDHCFIALGGEWDTWTQAALAESRKQCWLVSWKQAQVTELNIDRYHVLLGMAQAKLGPSCLQLSVSSVHALEVGVLCECPSPSASQTESRLSNPLSL